MTEINVVVFVILSLCVYRLCRLLIEDEIFDWARERVWKKFPPETTKIGYWTTCYHCSSVFFGLFVVVLYLVLPVPTLIGASILAISAVVGLIDHWKSN